MSSFNPDNPLSFAWTHSTVFSHRRVSFHRVSQVTFNLRAILVYLAPHLQWVSINSYHHFCGISQKRFFFIRAHTCCGILALAYVRAFGREISSWVAWASSPSLSGWRGSEGMLVTVMSNTTNRWSDRENTGTSSSSLHERKEEERKLQLTRKCSKRGNSLNE